MKTVPLSKGYVALVDDEDFERVSRVKWHVTLQKHRGLKTEYAQTSGKRPHRTIMMHRFVMNPEKGIEIDHWDKNGLNNQKGNLRPATHAQNMVNSGPKTGKKFKGVHPTPSGKWVVLCAHKSYGTFAREVDAAARYNEISKAIYGEFAYQNKLS